MTVLIIIYVELTVTYSEPEYWTGAKKPVSSQIGRTLPGIGGELLKSNRASVHGCVSEKSNYNGITYIHCIFDDKKPISPYHI